MILRVQYMHALPIFWVYFITILYFHYAFIFLKILYKLYFYFIHGCVFYIMKSALITLELTRPEPFWKFTDERFGAA